MPTVQVTPSSIELLQNVADTLGKAKKVVMITGAGISTNSGIPDFRSEHGLYSLIQAQFDNAEAGRTVQDDGASVDEENSEGPNKRRRTSKSQYVSLNNTPPSSQSDSSSESSPVVAFPGLKLKKVDQSDSPADEAVEEDHVVEIITPQARLEQSDPAVMRASSPAERPNLPRYVTEASSESSVSNDTIFSAREMSGYSTQTDLSVGTPMPEQSNCFQSVRTPTKYLGRQGGLLFSSSPLSSPPPILFDPYERSEEPTDRSSDGSEESGSEHDEEQAADFLSSQTSQARLRTMKGRDLFDSNIWSDPLKTSVFYRFATTLRQKVKDVEPTATHHFIARLRDIGKLTRVYTQNIDEIEKKIGLSTDLKVGAGNKRRKSTKQRLIDTEKTVVESRDQAKEKEDSGENDAAQPSQSVEAGDISKHRSNTPPEKGVECVFLHGSLQALRCFVCAQLCDWDEEDREALTMSGEQPECPHCAGATAARQEKGKRALGVGKLRPDIVLYGEEHPQSDLISPIVQHDLSTGPDLMLVLGTSLRVHGLKVMVKEFARAIHQRGGKVIFINFTKPSESTWGDVIDYWVQWDCDAWVNDLKERKPTLWMAPDAIVNYEKLKREELAGKRREAASIKKRESLNEKKRENSNSANRRATIQAMVEEPQPTITSKLPLMEDKPQLKQEPKPHVISEAAQPKQNLKSFATRSTQPKQTPVPVPIPFYLRAQIPSQEAESEPVKGTVLERKPLPKPEPGVQTEQKSSSKTKEPAKNPQAERNDTHCGAYCMSKIAEAFYLIRGEKFDFYGLTPSARDTKVRSQLVATTEPSRKPATKVRKPRRSAPAVFSTSREPVGEVKHHPRPAVEASRRFDQLNKDKFKKAASELFSTRHKQAPLRFAELRVDETPNGSPESMYADFQLRSSGNAVASSVREVSALPATARPESVLRPPPEIISVSHVVVQEYQPSAPVSASVKSNPRKRKPTAKAMINSSAPSTPAQVVKTSPLPLSIDQENILAPFRIGIEQQVGPRLIPMEPAFSPSPPRSPLDQTPLASLSPNQRRFSLQHLHHPMKLSSPLLKLPFGVRKESTPSPSDQLREEAAIALSGMRLCR